MSTKLHYSEHVNIIDNSSPLLTFLIDWGVNILCYNILTPLIFKKGILTMEWSTVSTKLHPSEHYHITDNTIPWLTFLIDWERGSNIMA